MAKATIDFAMRVNSDFLIYLEITGKIMIDDITPHDVAGYFMQDSFSGRKPEGIRAYAYKLKAFLTFLEDADIIKQKTLSKAVPLAYPKQESIVTVLSKEAVTVLKDKNLLLKTVTLVRDHAMILLALRIGIRQSDIINLKLADIDWKNDSISFMQQKTRVPIVLPLLPDVGNALMDYILNFRPAGCLNDTVFLRHYPPYAPLSCSRKIVKKYLAGFDSKAAPERGFHIMRRTFATEMLKNDIPKSVISASIGQVAPYSVDVYLSADEKQMRTVAISLKGIECARWELQ
jgi:integrase